MATTATPLPPELLAALARRGQPLSAKPGMLIVAEGEPSDAMYLIHEGRLRVFVGGAGGREVELNLMGEGEYFGELMLGSRVRTASIRALTAARLTRVGRTEFEAALAERPDLAFHLIQHLIERVIALSRNVQGLASMDVYGRMVRLFEESAQAQEDGTRFVPGPISSARIAARVGASRTMVHRILHDLAEGGWITLQRERVVLLKALPRGW